MKYQQQALNVQAQGRGPDTMLVHMAPSEVAGLQALAEQYGGSLTINPETGLPEAGFLEDILPAVVGAAAMFIPGMQGVGAYMLAGGLGAAAGLATQKEGESGVGALLRGALGGALGGAGGSLIAGAGGAGGLAALGETAAASAGTGATGALTAGMTQAEMLAAQTAGMGITDAAIPLASSGLSQAQMLAAQTEGMGLTQAEMLAAQEAGMGLSQAEMLAAQEAGMAPTQAEMLAAQNAGMEPTLGENLEMLGSKAKSWWDKSSWKDKAGVLSQARSLMTPEPEPRTPFAPMPSMGGYSPGRVDLPSGGGGGFAPRWSAGNAAAPGTVREALAKQRAQQVAFAQQGGFGAFPKARFAEGGEVGLQSGGFVVPADVVSALGSGSTDAGLRALAQLGAQPLRGEGDGQSDDIQARIDGKQPALVADGEAYLAPQQVAKLGGGSHTQGAKRLYDMMAQVRKQAHGHTEQQKPVDLKEALA